MGLVEVKRSDKGRFAFEKWSGGTVDGSPSDEGFVRIPLLVARTYGEVRAGRRVASTRNSLDSVVGTSRR